VRVQKRGRRHLHTARVVYLSLGCDHTSIGPLVGAGKKIFWETMGTKTEGGPTMPGHAPDIHYNNIF